jgi:hypothetical protein
MSVNHLLGQGRVRLVGEQGIAAVKEAMTVSRAVDTVAHLD